MEFKNYLRELRQSANFTQKEAADKMSVSVTSVQNWENGRSIPERALFGDIIRAYNADKFEFGNHYVEEIMKEISNIHTENDKMVILTDETFSNVPNEKDFKND